MERVYRYELTEAERDEMLGILWMICSPQDFAEATREKLWKDAPAKARRLHDLMTDDKDYQ